MIKVKVCGITNVEDAMMATKLGAWAIGFIFYKKSPRYVSPYKARKIIDALPPFITPVGVFVNTKEGAVKDILKFTGIHTVQFHGDEAPDYCRRFNQFSVIKAFRANKDFDIARIHDYKSQAYLFDAFDPEAFGGTGKTTEWNIAKEAKSFNRPVILSGGLTPQNVREAIEHVSPYAIDVSSGVEESPGKKSEQLLLDFFAAISV